MRQLLITFACVAALAAPVSVLAATVDASLIPDGTYTVKVEKVVDAQHITVLMPNGMETTLSARGSVSFTTIKPNANIKVSVIKGQIPVFQEQ